MNSKGHLFISLCKSIIRIFSGIVTIYKKSVIPIALGFVIAETLGIAEELVDKR